MKYKLITLIALLFSANALALNAVEDPSPPDMVTPTIEIGADIFSSRCTLCHGNVGMGEGVLATTLKDYPDTNLRNNKYGKDSDALRSAVIYGGQRGAMHNAMPPFGDELTWVELESVVKYMLLFYKDVDKAVALVRNAKPAVPPKRDMGRAIFKRRCTLCHGVNGDGKGKMARIIKNPPPYNLTLSTRDDDYLLKIIAFGGEKIKRSPRMPPFGEELSDNDIRSVILYIRGFRVE